MMEQVFEIGGFCFAVRYSEQVSFPENLLLFKTAKKPQYTYTIEVQNDLKPIRGQLVARRPDLMVFKTEQRESRIIGIKGSSEPVAVYEELSETDAHITYFPQWLPLINQDTIFNSLLVLEKRMLEQDAVVFHCAYIVKDGEAILFSGPSGMGKSTQADLWKQYKNVSIMNGDRALLRKINGHYYACGWPVCGSSNICRNAQYPIRAIVMLSQAKNNQTKRLSAGEAFRQIYPQITVNRWDTASNSRVMDLVTELAESQNVYHLACDISEQAVNCLHQAIYEENP